MMTTVNGNTYRYFSLKFGKTMNYTVTPKLYAKLLKKYQKSLNETAGLVTRPQTADEFITQWLAYHL